MKWKLCYQPTENRDVYELPLRGMYRPTVLREARHLAVACECEVHVYKAVNSTWALETTVRPDEEGMGYEDQDEEVDDDEF